MAAFYHIFLKPRAGVSDKDVAEKMNLAIDWYKYSDYGWVVKTTSDAAKWQARLGSLAKPDGTLLILKIDAEDDQGWIAKSFWDWFNQNKEPR